MKNAKKWMASLGLVAMSLSSLGCSFMARGAEDYRADTRELLSSRDAAIKECYDVALSADPKVAGDVVVNFTVEKKTGKVINPALDTEKSSAPAELGQCVLNAIDGLSLTPEDRRDGIATFTWSFAPQA